MIRSKEDIIVTRYQGTLNAFLFLGGFILKLKKQKLIIDVPTPISNLLKEMSFNKSFDLVSVLNKLQIIIFGPVSLTFATLVIQYADESMWFSIFSKQKTIKIGNGIDVESIPLKKYPLEWPSNTINLVGVGTVAIWHGYDRLIRAIKCLEDDTTFNHRINFNIIGDGLEIPNLKKLTNKLGLSNQIKFSGMLYNKKLYQCYENAHLGIGSLGWARVGIKEASPLKIREYLSAGLPVITATKDIDFSTEHSFYLQVTEEEEIESIVSLFKNIILNDLPSPRECRLFAEKKLDYSIKVNQVLLKLNNRNRV